MKMRRNNMQKFEFVNWFRDISQGIKYAPHESSYFSWDFWKYPEDITEKALFKFT